MGFTTQEMDAIFTGAVGALNVGKQAIDGLNNVFSATDNQLGEASRRNLQMNGQTSYGIGTYGYGYADNSSPYLNLNNGMTSMSFGQNAGYPGISDPTYGITGGLDTLSFNSGGGNYFNV